MTEEQLSKEQAALLGLYYALYYAPMDWWQRGDIPDSVVKAYARVQEAMDE